MIKRVKDECENGRDLVVVKFGSRALTGKDNSLDDLESNIQCFCEDLAQYSNRIVIVASGAVFCGKLLAPEIEDPAVLSTIGNPALAGLWQQYFSEVGVTSSQVLVTHRELEIDTERARLLSVLENSLSLDVVPIINENDALSDEELKKLIYGGDNDGLAAEIAKLLGAKYLVLYTDTGGFMVTGEVKRNLSLGELDKLDSHAGESDRGGGMATKLKAAKDFASYGSGIKAHIARAGEPLESVLSSEVGTTISQ